MIVRFYRCRPLGMFFPVLAWLIMIFQGMNPFRKKSSSHMAMGYNSITGNSKVADVTFAQGCADRVKARFIDHYTIVETKTRVYDITQRDFQEWYEEQEGKKYDKIQLGGLGAKVLSFITFNKLGSNFKKLICSELILSFMVRFDNLEVKDSDNWDMNMTWERV